MYNIVSGAIERGVLYIVYGAQSAIYNGTTYTTGQTFRGIASVSAYTFSGSGTQFVYEVLELAGTSIEFVENLIDKAAVYPDTTVLNGFAIEFKQNAKDIVFDDVTVLNGFAIELIDYPFYSFEIIEIEGD